MAHMVLPPATFLMVSDTTAGRCSCASTAPPSWMHSPTSVMATQLRAMSASNSIWKACRMLAGSVTLTVSALSSFLPSGGMMPMRVRAYPSSSNNSSIPCVVNIPESSIPSTSAVPFLPL